MYLDFPNSFDFKSVLEKEEKAKVEQRERGIKELLSFRLTERDFKVLEYIVDMKFATVADLYQKFFRRYKEENPKNPDLYTRERLLILRKHQLVKVERHAFDFRNFYLVTAKGVNCLEAKYPERMWPRPLTRIDIRTFEHDKVVNSLRLHLEEKYKVTNWWSERVLNADRSLTLGMSKDYLPDAIYAISKVESSWAGDFENLPIGESAVDSFSRSALPASDLSGLAASPLLASSQQAKSTIRKERRVAFEFENSPKTRSKYIEKISHYVDIMRDQDPTKRIFEKVHYVVVRENIYRFLKESTEIYGDLFQVEKLNNVLPEGIERGRR